MGLIDLNTTEEDETPSSGSSSTTSSSFSVVGLNTSVGSGSNLVVGASASASASASAPGSASSAVCLELWHACAGPLISLPKKGSVVVYFPQGQLEQLPDFSLAPAYTDDVPPHVFCRVLDVKLHVCLLIKHPPNYNIIYIYLCLSLCLSLSVSLLCFY